MGRFSAILAAATLGLAGCTSADRVRTEGVTTSSGNAVAANTVLQMVDPWPYGVQDTSLRVPAERPSSDTGPQAAGAGNTTSTYE